MSSQKGPVDQQSAEAAPRIGVDEWVAQAAGRQQQQSGPLARLVRMGAAIPISVRYGLVLLLLALLPTITSTDFVLDLLGVTDNNFILRIGARFLIFAMLAIGLNVVVGYAGLLDLGYVAFFGIAGYLYAYLSSGFVQIGDFIPYGLAVPSIISIPLIVAVTALVGWLIGAVSLRLSGDYLAIVTLGFGQIFVQLALTATRVKVPWLARPVDLTRGPNGINDLDNLALFSYTMETTQHYYYLFLVLLVLLFVGVDRLNRSRIGRAWRAVREDEFAAEVMGTPTRRVKLLAFAIGAAIAGLAGGVDAAWQGNVVPVPRYGVLTLINLYAMVVLGGLGSLPGVVIGAFLFTVLPEVLRSIFLAGILFYSALLLGLLAWLRPLRRFVTVLAGTILAGYVLKFLVNIFWPGLDSGYPDAGSILNEFIQGWLVIPANYQIVGNMATVSTIFFVLLLLLVQNAFWRNVLLGVTVYLVAFAWETRLAAEPAATRVLVVGLSLVLLMIFRPQGLLGRQEVKVV